MGGSEALAAHVIPLAFVLMFLFKLRFEMYVLKTSSLRGFPRLSTVNLFLRALNFAKQTWQSPYFLLQASWYCQFDIWLLLHGATPR